MITEALSVTAVAVRVGYESASQFSREYSRLFGQPPGRDTTQLAEALGKRELTIRTLPPRAVKGPDVGWE